MWCFAIAIVACVLWRAISPPDSPALWAVVSLGAVVIGIVVDRLLKAKRIAVLKQRIESLRERLDDLELKWTSKQEAREDRHGMGSLRRAGKACEDAGDQIGRKVQGAGNLIVGMSRVPVAREAAGVAAIAAAGAILAPTVAGKTLKWLGRTIAGKEPKTAMHQQVERELTEAQERLDALRRGLGCSIVIAVIAAVTIAIFWP
jgi:hypothetical protein